MIQRLLIAFMYLFSQVAFAVQEQANVMQGRLVYVEFISPTTNTKEPVRLKVKDTQLGSTALIRLDPQPKHPGTWYGYFIIQFAQGDQSSKVLEFSDAKGKKLFTYAPPSGETQQINLFVRSQDWNKYVNQFSPEAIESAKQKFAEKEALRNEKEAQKAAALAAKDQKKAAELAAKAEKKALEEKRKADELARLEQARLAEEAARMTAIELAKKQEEVRRKEQEQEQARIKMEQDLAIQREEKIRQQQALSAREKQKIRDRAESLAQQAMNAYKVQNYVQAENLFQQATEVDSSNDKFYYQYGVTLYKNGKYNKSLATLSMAEGADVNKNEQAYYIALNQMKLKEYDKALKGFKEIRGENDPELSPVASFFAGNIEYQNQQYSDARTSFEYVVDNSKDPQLDREAENMLEEIDKLENFLSSPKEKFRYNFTAGAIYDQNILNISSSNASTDVGGFRVNYGASLTYHLYKGYRSELSGTASFSDYYSLNTKMQPDATLQAADPMELFFSLPYKMQFDAAKKNYNLDITPGYKNLIMNPDATTRRNILTTTSIGSNLSTAMTGTWLTAYKFEYASDVSQLSPASTDDNSSATKYTLGTTQTYLLDPKGSESIAGDLLFLQNQATGKNNRYLKTALGVTYAFPFIQESSGSFKFDYSSQNYSEASTARVDNILTLTLSNTKDLTKSLNMNLSLQYTNSASDLDVSKYNKFMLTSLFTYSGSVLKEK